MELLFFLISFFVAVILTFLIRKLALKLKIIDVSGIDERKIHKESTPLLGGLAIFLSFFIVLFIVRLFWWPACASGTVDKVLDKYLIGLFIAGAFLMVGGILDDKYCLSPKKQIIWPILACLIVIISGIGVKYINNPFGSGYLHFDKIKFEIARFSNTPYYFIPWSDIITFIWLMLLMYSTKLLDGLDGLVSGITVIGALIIAGFCFLTPFFQPDVGIMSLILAGASLGFLCFNWHPAKIFLGEGGSLFVGFMLGILAIISGSKVATAFLILGLAIIDLISVVMQRIFIDHKSPFKGDQKHFHFRLLKFGLSHRLVVILYWLIAVIFGLNALIFKTKGKIIILVVLILLSLGFTTFFSFKEKKICQKTLK
jgi:UDP-GlcNAc:undecaprenyl-phosphate GlcNAc-1-phosphate transferase